MRAKEFINEDTAPGGTTITIPITINIPAGGGAATVAAPAGEDLPDAPVMVPPLQQHLELAKQQGGKESQVINQLINQDPENPDDFVNHENDEQDAEFDRNIRDEDESGLVLDLLKRRRDRLEYQ